MADILRSVSSAFAFNDTKINYHLAEKGSSSLLTGIYSTQDDVTNGFYKKPDITSDDSTKLAVIYGEVMITPNMVDAGVESSTNDAGSILKTYRFIMGDGVNSGPVTGPNGSPLENVYIKDPNGVPQPVVDSDGRPSMANVIMASVLGGAITSAPKIWDAIKGSTPASSQTKTVDPVTGKPLPSTTEKAAAAIGKNLSLGGLTNVDESGKGDNFVLTYDASAGKWVPKSINPLLGDSVSSDTICGGDGGSGGTGGSGGGSTVDTPIVQFTPNYSSYSRSINLKAIIDSIIASGSVSLYYVDDAGAEQFVSTFNISDISAANGSITQTTFTSGIETILNNFFKVNGSISAFQSNEIVYQVSSSNPVGNSFGCSANAYIGLRIKTGASELTSSIDSSDCGPCSVKTPNMQTRNVVAASTTDISFDSVSFPSYSVTLPTITADFTRSNGTGRYYLSALNVTSGGAGFYRTVTFEAALGVGPVTVRGRANVSGGAITSVNYVSSDAYQTSSTTGVAVTNGLGYNPNTSTTYYETPRASRRMNKAAGISSIDGVTINVGDLFLLKDQTDKKQNGIYKKTTSTQFDLIEELSAPSTAINGVWTHVTGGTVNASKDFMLNSVTATEGPVYFLTSKQQWQDVTLSDPCTTSGGSSGGSGSAGSSGSCTTIETDPKPQPSITLQTPCARQYGVQTTPPAFDAITLPYITLETGIASTACSVVYSVTTGDAQFQLAGAIPGTVTSFISDREILLTGPDSDVEVAGLQVQIKPSNSSKGEITYTVTITNADGTKAGVGCTLVSSQIVVKDSQAAKAKFCIDAATTTGSGRVMVTFNERTLDLTDGFIPFNTNVATTATDMVLAISANVATKNTLDPTDPFWLPNFTAQVTGTGEITVEAPAAGGAEFNGVTITPEATGGFIFGDCPGTMVGGVTKTVTDFLKNNVPNWDKVSNVLLGIGGNVLGAVLTNVIMNNVGQTQISLPTEADVDLAFLYRGRVIKVPNEYNATARTGHPSSYDTWSTAWKTQYSNNPAWVVYDFIVNKKYGLGRSISLTSTQEEALLRDIFKIGYYCDDVINSNPRFSTNTVITDGTKMEILKQLCSVFFGGYTFVSGGLRIVIDKPETTVKLLVNQTNASNIEKEFSNVRNFINKVRVSYVEPSSFYTEDVVVAEILESIETYGERASDLIAFGCTDADQALRYATQVLNSELKNTINISYIGGFDHYNLMPGDIVEFYDQSESTSVRAGRIVSQSGTTVVLDRTPTSAVGDNFSLTCSDGSVHLTTIAAKSGATITMASAPAVSAIPYQTWIGNSAALGRQLYRVIKIDETSNLKFSVHLQLYKADKY